MINRIIKLPFTVMTMPPGATQHVAAVVGTQQSLDQICASAIALNTSVSPVPWARQPVGSPRRAGSTEEGPVAFLLEENEFAEVA